MAIAPISVGDTNARAKMNEAIAKANLVDEKASAAALTAGLAAEAQARQAAILALPLSMPIQHRPGDAPLEFGRSLADGEAGSIAGLSESLLRYDEAGKVVRLTGDDIVAPRHLFALEPGRRYLATFAVQRRVNSPDPDNDAIRCAFAWYGQGKGRLLTTPQTIAQDLLGLTTGSGRQVVRAVVSRAAGADVDIVAPAGGRYVRPYVQTFGGLVQNDVEIINWVDITDAVAFAPDVSALEDRVASVESLDLGARVSLLESQVTAPNDFRVATIGDFDAATIPVSVDTVLVLGWAAPADGGGWRYRSVATEPAHPGKRQSIDGRWWEMEVAPGLNIARYGGLGDGVVDCTQAIANMADHVGYVVIGAGFHLVDDVTVDVKTTFLDGGMLVIPTGKTATFRTAIDAPRQQIFSGDGNVSFDLIPGAGGEESKQAHIVWFGVWPGENLGDQGARINKATAAFGNLREGILYFDNGVYGTNQTIYVPRGLAIEGKGTRKTLFYPLSDGWPCFETQGPAAHWLGIQFEVNRDVMPLRASPYINILHESALVRDCMFTNCAKSIVSEAEGTRCEQIGWNHDRQDGGTDSALITLKRGNATVSGLYGDLGRTYGPENLVLIAPTAKLNAVTVEGIRTAARSRPVKVNVTTHDITGLSIERINYGATAGVAPANAVEFNIAGGRYCQGITINGLTINSRPLDGLVFNVDNNGILEVMTVDNFNILGSTSPSTRVGIKFAMGAGATGAIRYIQIGKCRNIVRPSGQEVVVPVDARVNVTVH